MTVDSGEIVAVLGAVGTLLAAAGGGLWRGLVLILRMFEKTNDSQRQMMDKLEQSHERMHSETTTALRENAVATVKHAHAIEGLSRAVDGLQGRVAVVERHIERTPTERLQREPEQPSRVGYDPAMRTRP